MPPVRTTQARYPRVSARDRPRSLPGRPSLSTDDVGRMMGAALAQMQARNQGYVVAGEQMERDPAWGTVPFGPGWPLRHQPIDRNQAQTGRPKPRSYEYDVSENIQIGQRERLTPWNILQQAADQPLFRKCINRRKSICELPYAVVIDPRAIAARQSNLKDKGEARDIEAALRAQHTDDIVRISTWLEEPDKWNGQDWEHWCAMLMEQHLVFDAVPVTIDVNVAGDPAGFRILDGKTIKPLIDEWGNRPLPPRPAYQQILWGYPRGEWAAASAVEGAINDGDTVAESVFAANELSYERRIERRWTQYGLPPTEVALIDGLLWSRRFGWILGEYTEGVQPASFLINKGDVEWSPELNSDYEHSINDRLSGNTAERMRYKLLPVGIEPVQSVEHAERYRPDYDLFIIKLVAGDFGIPITEIGFTETGALGSSFHEGNQDILNRQTRIPDANWVGKKATWLCRRYLKMPSVLMVKILGLESEDEAAADEVAQNRVRSGRATLNQDNARRGQPPYPFPEADMPMLMTDRGVIFLEGASKSAPAGVLIQPPHLDMTAPGQPPGPSPAGGAAPAAGKAGKKAKVAKRLARQPADQVISQLADDYPVSQLEWVRHATWHGPMEVNTAALDTDNEESWKASSEDERVNGIADKIRRKAGSGSHVKPAVIVRVPGKKKARIVDGHHRAEASQRAGQPLWAWVGNVSHETGPWDNLHDYQFHEGDAGTDQYADDQGGGKAKPAAKDEQPPLFTLGRGVPASPEVVKAEIDQLRRWLRRNTRPHRPFTCQVAKAADLGELASDPRVTPADGRPKDRAGTGPAGTPTPS